MNEPPRKLSHPISAVLNFIVGTVAFLTPCAVKAAVDYGYQGEDAKANVTFVGLARIWAALRQFTLTIVAMTF